MKKTMLLLAAAGCLVSVPALAGAPAAADKPIILAEELCVGPACIGTHEERRYRSRDECREVTIRERRGDEVVERRVRRCDD
jgi:hypothetical protein